MKTSTLLKVIGIAVLGTVGGFIANMLLKRLNGELIVLLGVVALTVAGCALVMHFDSAAVMSKPDKLKDANDYRNALTAWIAEDTPYTDLIRVAVTHLESLERKEKALRSILDETKGSPFLTTADDVERYILANTKRFLNRIMISDGTDQSRTRNHIMYLQQLLQQDSKVLGDFENLIVEISQIGDDSQAETPCLKELTEALRSMREPVDENAVWEHLDEMNRSDEQMQQEQQMRQMR